LHVHTSWSLDAYGSNKLNDPAVAYRYGRGETIDGERLCVPLDFIAVTDHDAYFGALFTCLDPQEPVYNGQTCQQIRKTGLGSLGDIFSDEIRHPPGVCGEGDQSRCMKRAADMWKKVEENANAFYQPGKFTTFTAYEWTGMRNAQKGAWIHRRVRRRSFRARCRRTPSSLAPTTTCRWSSCRRH
jgi:hypothetical protein